MRQGIRGSEGLQFLREANKVSPMIMTAYLTAWRHFLGHSAEKGGTKHNSMILLRGGDRDDNSESHSFQD